MSNPEACGNSDNTVITNYDFVRINSNSTVSDRLYILPLVYLAQKIVKWQALANMVVNFWIPETPRNFLTGWAVATC